MLSCVQNFYNWSFLLISFTIYVVYLYYIWTLFENDRHYSHLSELEREMSFRSEMAFYYYYFKVFTEDLFADGSTRRWWNILREDVFTDHQSQAPNVVNAHYSYNIVPEILIGTSYRLIHCLMEQFDLFQYSRQCWLINRGDSNLLPVESCEGFGDPSYFYCGNTFVLKSFYASFVISAMINMKLFSHSKNKSSMLIMIWKAIVMAMMTISIKLLISWCLDHNRQDDEEHIWTLALAIYDPSTFANFHTRLYTCANEFNYMSSSEWNKLTYETWIIPSAIIGSIIHRFLRPQKLSIQLLTDYSLILCLAFAFLAAFIMRLKLLFIPQLCILSGLICSRKDQTTSIGYRLISLRLIIFILLVSIIFKPGMKNIRHDLSINGEYSNGPLEEMIEFIRQPNGPIKSNDIFAVLMMMIGNGHLHWFQFSFSSYVVWMSNHHRQLYYGR
ncbi:hypothetical protein BLOT_004960 [Blomia tropicalis]|nr:hypothetical protein BLOT_004960 [Blomia tropicalis]